jgi:hypothetical protein
VPYFAEVGNHRVNLYTVSEFAAVIGISYRTAWQYVHDERIPSQKIAGKWLISEYNILAFLNGAKHLKNPSTKTGKYAPKDFKVKPIEYPQFKEEL